MAQRKFLGLLHAGFLSLAVSHVQILQKKRIVSFKSALLHKVLSLKSDMGHKDYSKIDP